MSIGAGLICVTGWAVAAGMMASAGLLPPHPERLKTPPIPINAQLIRTVITFDLQVFNSAVERAGRVSGECSS
jgi:hypothetical protein